MNFGQVIELLKEGRCIQRNGWNGKGLFVFKQVPSTIDSWFLLLVIYLRKIGVNTNYKLCI